jgi:hypothetical protein
MKSSETASVSRAGSGTSRKQVKDIAVRWANLLRGTQPNTFQPINWAAITTDASKPVCEG